MPSLSLKRPLVFIDIESTGINVGADRIVELALLKIHSNNTKDSKRYLINPTIPIPEVVTKIQEFTRAGVHFDISSVKLVDVQNIFHKMEQRTLSAAYKFYCNKVLEGAHTAEADTNATFEVLIAQLEKYDSLKGDVDFLSQFSTMHRNVDLAGRVVMSEEGVEVFNFGKHKGKSVREVFKKDASYYDWIMQGDFATNTKNVITQLRLKDFNKI